MDTRRLDRLHLKLFAAIAGTIAVLTLAAYAVFSWSFDRGFVEYLQRADRMRLHTLSVKLAEGYGREGNWSWIAADRSRWVELIRSTLGLADTSGSDAGGAATAAPGGMPLTFDPRLLLLDSSRHVVAGRSELLPRTQLEPIVWQGATVGYVGYVPRPELLASIESVYLSRQHLTFAALAAAMLMGSLLLGAGVSYWLTRRVRSLVAATRSLIEGEYGQRLRDHGHDELAQLARDFNTLAQTLEASRQSRRQWIADISHELRTPLSILRGEIEALQDGVRPLEPAAVNSLAAEAGRLARLVEDLHTLSLSDLGALAYYKEPVDLAEVIEEVIEPQRRVLAEQGMKIEMLPIEGAVIDGDAGRLGQLFGNLLQNSARYTDTPGTIAINLSRRNGFIAVDWEDSAPGVPHEELQRLTERLYRVDASRSRAGGGSGLGLAIVQALVHGHGGRLNAHPSGLGGVRIHMEFPAAGAALHA